MIRKGMVKIKMWLFYYLAGINLITLCIFGIDKFCAMHQKQRISEAVLLTFCLLGGAFGGALGMLLFHHKVSKAKFRYSVPALFLFYFIAVFLLIKEVML